MSKYIKLNQQDDSSNREKMITKLQESLDEKETAIKEQQEQLQDLFNTSWLILYKASSDLASFNSFKS